SSQRRRPGASSGSASSSKRLMSAICGIDSPIGVSSEGLRRPPQPSIFLPQRGGENQPRLLPVALHRALGDAQRFSYFLLAVTTKVAHLRHLGQARVRLLQSLQRLVNTQDRFLVLVDLARQLAGQGQRSQATPAPLWQPAAR